MHVMCIHGENVGSWIREHNVWPDDRGACRGNIRNCSTFDENLSTKRSPLETRFSNYHLSHLKGNISTLLSCSMLTHLEGQGTSVSRLIWVLVEQQFVIVMYTWAQYRFTMIVNSITTSPVMREMPFFFSTASRLTNALTKSP